MNTKEKLVEYIKEQYNAYPEYLWEKTPDYAIFRNRENRKWFAIIMKIKYSQIGLKKEGLIDIMNIKGDPVINGSLRLTHGILPGYHMNKENWLTILLDGSVDIELIKELIDMSVENTKNKKKNR